MLDLKPSPVRVSSEAARKLPRTLLLTLLSIFILVGLFSRDLWSSQESRMLAEVLAMISGDPVAWLFPMASGEVITEHGPLATWLAAVFVAITPDFVSQLWAMRATAVVWFVITTASLWYGTWFLARRREAQPISQPFGREAPYRDYGRLVADTATLFFISIFGLVVKNHEATVETVELAFGALAYFGCAWSLTRPYWGSALAGLASGALILASSLLAGVTVLTGCVLSHVLVHGIGRLDRKILTTVLTAFALFSLWPAVSYCLADEVAGDYFNLWAQSQADIFGLINFHELGWLAKHFIWYLCPTWPFAVWAIWVWRRSLSVTQIAMPLAFCAAWILGFILSDRISAETLLCVVIAPICTLAAFGLMSTKTESKSMLEWFAIAVFTLALIGVWAYWTAWSIGFPPKMHYSILRLVADESQAHSAWPGVLAALAVSAFWMTLCLKRLKKRAIAFWNGPWLSAVGLTVLWITAIGLFEPVIDSNRTYKNIASEVKNAAIALHYAPGEDCLQSTRLNLSERSAISWHSGLTIVHASTQVCRFYIDKYSVEDEAQSADASAVQIESFRPRSDDRYRVGAF